MSHLPSILLVDDDQAHRRLIRRALSKAGLECDVIEADGLRAARELLFKEGNGSGICAAVVDLNLGDGRGTVLISEMRADERFNSLPIIVLSTSGLEKDMTESLEAGASEYLKKADDPLTFAKEIAETIARLLSSRP